VARGAVAAAANGQLQPGLAGQVDDLGDAGRPGGPDDDGRPLVVAAEEDRPGPVVAVVPGVDDLTGEAAAQ
jgi:hypothetical protein